MSHDFRQAAQHIAIFGGSTLLFFSDKLLYFPAVPGDTSEFIDLGTPCGFTK